MRHHSLRHPSPASATEHLPGSESRLARASTSRCARGQASLPQGSLAPVRVVLSRSISAYYDPIRQSRRHAATSRPGRLYAAPSLGGSAAATRDLPSFRCCAVHARRRPYTGGSLALSRCVRAGYQAPSDYQRVATHRCPSLPAILDGVKNQNRYVRETETRRSSFRSSAQPSTGANPPGP